MISILEPSLPHSDVYLVYTVRLECPHGNSGFRVMKVTVTELLNVVDPSWKLSFLKLITNQMITTYSRVSLVMTSRYLYVATNIHITHNTQHMVHQLRGFSAAENNTGLFGGLVVLFWSLSFPPLFPPILPSPWLWERKRERSEDRN